MGKRTRVGLSTVVRACREPTRGDFVTAYDTGFGAKCGLVGWGPRRRWCCMESAR